MSNLAEREAEDVYERQNDPSPVSGSVPDNSYASGTGRIPVQKDDEAMEESPMQPPFSNTDQQLAQDEREAVDRSNILDSDRLRHAQPQTSTGYDEGPTEEDLPAEVKNARY
ncbi:hypothetical protein PHISCL_07581 [Aspergillus sclerotialis]|uniref:Uncharacterized protein n=1 Tax=Aspergillus sclerotialis TaxID=2070753 RepID=A0A3A2ZB00_9EURO|nr:hypothetical protein PHISCL_07581 [Aspergillus sclerotialis]